MKVNKTISIDVELIKKINLDTFNVSEICNERLWEYFNNLEEVREEKTTSNIDTKIDELKGQKIKQERIAITKEEMNKAGITAEHIKFLKGMSTKILQSKDTKETYFNKFKEHKDWAELLALKRKWI